MLCVCVCVYPHTTRGGKSHLVRREPDCTTTRLGPFDAQGTHCTTARGE